MTVRAPSPIEWVVFDVGETLVDETRVWAEYAAAIGVTPFTMSALVGVTIERRIQIGEVWSLLGVERPQRRAGLSVEDLYPDAADCLRALAAAGYRIGIAGNQPAGAELQLGDAGLPVEFVRSSGAWGVSKPDPAFFHRVREACGVQPQRIAYVGDRLDNDVLPAQGAGMLGVFLVRGPWGAAHDAWPEAARADARITGLDQLLGVLSGG